MLCMPLLCKPLPRRIVVAEAVDGRAAAALDGRTARRRAAPDSAAALDGAPKAGAAANAGAGAAALPKAGSTQCDWPTFDGAGCSLWSEEMVVVVTLRRDAPAVAGRRAIDGRRAGSADVSI